jgi:UDP-N-acetyl-2-amino-2-deoxyglucuronate dehydrogenase
MPDAAGLAAPSRARPIRTALVGCGKVGRTHAQALKSLPHSQFVAVCHPRRERAEAFARDFGVNAYSDLATMLSDERVEMLSVCTPHPAHASAVAIAAAHGVHVMVEKPLAPDLADCDRAVAACRAARVKLGVISQRRLYAPVLRLRQAIEAGRIGTPILAELVVLGWRDRAYYESDRWRGSWQGEGGGVLINQTPHQLDLLQWLMGPIDELAGYWDNYNHPYIEVDDTAVALVRFRNGALASLVLSNSQEPGLYGRIHIHGSNGASVGVQTESGSPFIAGVTAEVEPPINDLWTIKGEEHLLAGWQAEDRRLAQEVDVMTHYHGLQLADFLEAIDQDREPLVNGEEGRKVVEMVTAIYRSQRDHRSVRFPLEPEEDRDDLDGRITHLTFSRGARS